MVEMGWPACDFDDGWDHRGLSLHVAAQQNTLAYLRDEQKEKSECRCLTLRRSFTSC
jgi:hypothetical protein